MKIENVEKLVANLRDKTEYIINIRNLKETLNHGLFFKKVYKVIKFYQNTWVKLYTEMNTDIWKKVKNNFEKFFISWCMMHFLEKLCKMWESIVI